MSMSMSRELPPRSMSVIRQVVLLGAVLTVGYLASCIHKSSRVYLFQQALCRNYYQANDPTKINSYHHVEEALCKRSEVQSPLSILDGVDSILQYLPGLLVLATYEKMLGIVGVRSLLVFNCLLSALGVLFSTVIFWLHQPWAPYLALLSFVYEIIGGGEITRIALTMMCTALISPPNRLTKYYNYVSAFWDLSSVGGSAIGSVLLTHHVWWLNALSVLCFIIAACLAAALPSELGKDGGTAEDTRPIILASDDPDVQRTSSESDLLRRETRTKQSLISILLHSWHESYLAILHLFHLPNPTFTVISIFLLNGLAIRIDVLLPQYISLTLSWPLAKVNRILALNSLVSSLIYFGLPTFRKVYLEPQMPTPQIDLLVVQSALLANMLGMLGFGFSSPAPFFLLSLCVYTAGSGVYDSLTAYGSVTLPPSEKVAEFYVYVGLANTLAGLFGAPLWSLIFSAVLKISYLPLGLPFWLCAALFGAGISGARILRSWMASRQYERVASNAMDE